MGDIADRAVSCTISAITCWPLQPKRPVQCGQHASSHKMHIAAQVCTSCNLRCNQEGVPIEAFLKDHLQHPQLVRLLDSATAHRSAMPRFGRSESSELAGGTTPPKSGSVGGTPGDSGDSNNDRAAQLELETWLLLEYCDMGTLMVSNGVPS